MKSASQTAETTNSSTQIIEDGIQSAYDRLGEVIYNPTECSNNEIEELEEYGLKVAEQVQDFVMSIDVVENQFSLHDLYEQAQKLGLDLDDLKEYGFDVKGVNCGGKLCPKSYDEFTRNGSLMGAKMALKSIDEYAKISCHPFVKKHVTPHVKYFWDLLPLWNLMPCTACCIDTCLCPCCWWAYCGFQFCFCPINSCVLTCECCIGCLLLNTFPCVYCLACCIQVFTNA